MDILKLRSFVMVARLGHLTRAAERLFLTQPAVTAHIKAIEQELGIALFDRAPGRISEISPAYRKLPGILSIRRRCPCASGSMRSR